MSTAIVVRPPRTLLEVFQSLPEGTHVQLIENNLVMSPAPAYIHQRVLMKIISRLLPFVMEQKLGEVLVAPVDVYLDDRNAFQPDIVFIGNERKSIIEEDGLHGAPELVIEILSPKSRKYDLGEKKDVYERSDVLEYWAVEPTTLAVRGWHLADGKFEEFATQKGKISSVLLKKNFEV